MLFHRNNYGTAKRLGGLESGKTANEIQFLSEILHYFSRCILMRNVFFLWVLSARARARARARPSRARWASGPCPQRGVNIFLGGARMLFLFSFFRREAPCGGGNSPIDYAKITLLEKCRPRRSWAFFPLQKIIFLIDCLNLVRNQLLATIGEKCKKDLRKNAQNKSALNSGPLQ